MLLFLLLLSYTFIYEKVYKKSCLNTKYQNFKKVEISPP